MNILQSLNTYTRAQRMVGKYFIIIGSVLLVLAAIFTSVASTFPFSEGVKWGSIVMALLAIIVGVSYRVYCIQVQKKAEAIYRNDTLEFIKSEYKRMHKVDGAFMIYQIFFALVILCSTLMMLFTASQVIKGVSFSISLLIIGILVVEGVSHISIRTYAYILEQELKNISNK